MGRPPIDAPPSTSWVDYWIDNHNYCAFFGCDDENSIPGTSSGCCVGSTSNCFLGDSDPRNQQNFILSSSCATSMSQSFRISSLSGDEGVDVSDFAAQHDSLLDSLLREQQEQLLARSSAGVHISSSNNTMLQDLRTSDSSGGSGLNVSATSISTTHSWTLSPTSSNDSLSDNGADTNTYNSSNSVTRKRRRGLLLVATPRMAHFPTIAASSTLPPQEKPPLSGSSNRNLPPLRSSSEKVLKVSATSSSNSTSAAKPPESFFHPAVRLQKDKGKGSEVGSEICAKGIPACVGKLRQKMQLLTEHCSVQPGGINGSGTTALATTTGAAASMKRRNAIVAERHPNFVETRSLLTIRMGFLSMSYGILLRWDTGKTGLVTVVVLRKNCHESFYKRSSATGQPLFSFPQTISTVTPTTPSDFLPRSSTHNSVSPTTSVDEDDGDDIVRLSEPPYLIPRPPTFCPSEVVVSVLYATGLHKKSHWTVQLQLGDQIENILLSHDGTLMTPKLGGPLRYTIPATSETKNSSPSITSGAIDAVLEIRLLEHKVRRKTRVLRCSMVLPLCSIEAIGSSGSDNVNGASSAATPTQLRIPCPDGGAIQLQASLVSDEAIWQRDELAARQKQRLWWKNSSALRSPVTVIDDVSSNKSSSWDWLFCSLC
jgi:hypothetical protein